MSQGGSSLIANWVTIGLLLIVTHQVRSPAIEPTVESQQWLQAETTQMIPVGAGDLIAAAHKGSPSSPRAAPASPVTTASTPAEAPAASPSDPDDGDEATQVVPVPGGRP
jgi:hypothetical protein